MIQVALLDDHPAVLAGLRRLIDPEPDLRVVAAAPSATELGQRLGSLRPDVLVLDYDIGSGDGLSHSRRVKDRPNAPRVVVYSAYASPALVLAARVAAADAVVDKTEPVVNLLAAIRSVAGGAPVLPVVPRDAYEGAVRRLDDQDLPVFAMLLDGESRAAIAQALRTDRTEIAWRTRRILGRLAPRIRAQPEERVA
jgi:two-component system, NarL family, response regulator DevR